MTNHRLTITMIRYRIVTLLLTVFCIGHALAIGTWNIYHAYNDITQIVPMSQRVYVLSAGGLFSYNVNDQSVQTYTKADALSDNNIALIESNKATQKLVIVYRNSNIDLLDDNTQQTTNISAYYSRSMMEDKTVYHIHMNGQYAYLSTGFGILILNVARGEITNTYNLGFRIDYSYIEDQWLYAASSTNGLYRGSTKTNLLDKANWQRVGEYTPRQENKTTVEDTRNNLIWTTTGKGMLSAYRTTDGQQQTVVSNIRPDGPAYNYFGFMRHINGKLYSVGGGFTALAEIIRPAAVQTYDGQTWTLFEEDIRQYINHNYENMLSVDVDPTDAHRVIVTGKSGVYEFIDEKFSRHWNIENSPLQSALTDNRDYVLAMGCKVDSRGTLWTVNAQAESQSLLEMSKDGQWTSHHKSVLLNEDNRSYGGLRSVIIDSRELVWFTNYHWDGPSFYAYSPKNDGILPFKSFLNQDGTRMNPYFAQCIAEDASHNIWVGTNVGPIVVYAEDIANNDNSHINQVKVPRNDGTNFADYLLDGVNITCIAVDGGGRKWFGTGSNGVYLISTDNNTQIHHFTTDNSPLLSNNIESIAINGKTGEVFIGTNIGLCSYMSDATDTHERMDKDNVYAYPNPVRPDYNGLITITGLTYDADVKIVTSNGVLVNQGRSNGGSYTWDATDMEGHRVASGIYMVQTATSDGKKGTVCKIAIVN